MRASVRSVGRVRVVVAVAAVALICAGGASAESAGWTAVTINTSDTTALACAYINPSGPEPAGGWPGVILFHGLGQSHTDGEPIGSALGPVGFSAPAFPRRGPRRAA